MTVEKENLIAVSLAGWGNLTLLESRFSIGEVYQ